MIIHFVVDEKIIDQMIDNFLQVSSNNLFLVFTEYSSDNYRHITRIGPHLKNYNYKKEDINEILKKNDVHSVILHQLNLKFAKTINKIKHNVNISWIPWGFDVYNLPKIESTLYAPLTKIFLVKNRPLVPLIWLIKKNNLTRRLFFNLKGKKDYYREIYRAINKVTYFSTYIREDFYVFTKYYNIKGLSFVETSFSSIDQYLAGDKHLRVDKNATSIIIGNSNTPESNYLDVIPVIGEKDFKIEKVFCVLSYGINNKHKKKVIFEGRKHLKDFFCPLTDFMPREEYIKILQTCSTGIFYHYRQQAMGNIIALLYLGARVYLSVKNPAYLFFKRIGVKVFNFEYEFDIFLNTKLSLDDIENNRKKLDSIFNKEKVINDLSSLSNLLDKSNVNS